MAEKATSRAARVQFLVRASGMLFCFAMVASALAHRAVAWPWWTGLVLHTFVFPYAAYAWSKRAREPKARLLLAMYVDALLAGHYPVLFGFELWPTVAVLGANAASNLFTGGLRLELRALLCSALGASLTLAVYGFRFTPDSSLLTSLLGIGFVVAYIGIVSSGANKVMAELRKTKLEIEAKRQEIEGFASVLEREVEAKTRELREANEKLERADRLKDEFLANTSHELKTPLNGIIGLAEAMLDGGAAGALPPAVRAKVTMIAASGRRLGALVNDLLDFSKLKHRELRLSTRPVDLRSVVEVVLSLSRHLVQSRGLGLDNAVPEGTWVIADEDRLQQILYNLVGNAIKFTERGGVKVSAEAGDGRVTVRVRDTGIGIDEADHERIFGSFEQVDGGNARERGGTGLGLSITRQLVELHGGKIGVESALGQGATFWFTLERAEPSRVSSDPGLPVSGPRASLLGLLASDEGETERAPPPPSRPAALRPSQSMKAATARPGQSEFPPAISARSVRVLAADDDPVNLAVLLSQLEPEGFEIVQAADGAEALDKLEREGPFDAALLDVMMPRMTGYEVCARIRERFAAAELPVVLLTAKNQVSDLVAGFEAGANDYLTKPFSKKELLARIQSHLAVTRTNYAFGRFVPKEFIRLLGHDNVIDVALGDNVEQQMTVLFSDIRNFTSIAERLTPAETFRFVNRCLSRIGPQIRLHGGFIDKYIGDAVMALFPAGPADAVRAAVAIQRQVCIYNATRKDPRSPALSVGVGLHAGPTMLGTIGENERFEATVISDTVNLASRVEGLTKHLCARVIITESVRSALPPGEFSLRALGSVRAKGKAEAIALHEVLDAEDEPSRLAKEASRATFERGVAALSLGEPDEAVRLFEQVLSVHHEDGAAAFLASQARALGRRAAGEAFDGAISLEVK